MSQDVEQLTADAVAGLPRAAKEGLDALGEEMDHKRVEIEVRESKLKDAQRTGDANAPVRLWTRELRELREQLEELEVERDVREEQVKAENAGRVRVQVEALTDYEAKTDAEIGKAAPREVKKFESFAAFIDRIHELEKGAYGHACAKRTGLARQIDAPHSHPDPLHSVIGIRSAAQWGELRRALKTIERLLEKDD